MVFSIDIDPSIPEKLRPLEKNVSFLTGPSFIVLPLLLKELECSGIPVDFILIDKVHPVGGMKRDIACLLSYVPEKPLFVMMHDSFNSECRRGILEAEWEKSPYVNWVDVDLVPGRIVEEEGSNKGQLGGGFGLAYFLPHQRATALQINQSAKMMFDSIRRSE
jgi:hypothetical protein